MNIVIIGTGNVAHVLGRKFRTAGHRILQVFGRSAPAASELAYILDTESTNYWSMINKGADIYLLAVSDEALKEITKHLRLQGKIVVHTAAAVPGEILKEVSSTYGVFYPLQSLHKEMTTIPETPIHVDASDDKTLRVLESLASSISRQVAHAGNDERARLHVAAVFCNNFVNHLYAMAEEYCRREKLDFKLLLPLIMETAEKLRQASPSHLQTGPALRQDKDTIAKHLAILDAYPELKVMYAFMTDSIARVNP